MKIKSTIAALALLGVMLTAGCSATAEDDPDALSPAADAPAPVEEIEAEPEPEPEPEPENGSIESPFPAGYEATVFEGSEENVLYTVTAALADDDAWAEIAKANQFNEAPSEGMKYVIVSYTVKAVDEDEPTNVSWSLYDYAAGDINGVTYRDVSVVLPDSMPTPYDASDLYAGQSFTAYVAYEVPASLAEVYVTAFGSYFTL